MSHYRIYFLNDAGQSYRRLELDCADDGAALLAADAQHGGRAMQLWAGARVIKTYPASEKAPQSPPDGQETGGHEKGRPAEANRPSGVSLGTRA